MLLSQYSRHVPLEIRQFEGPNYFLHCFKGHLLNLIEVGSSNAILSCSESQPGGHIDSLTLPIPKTKAPTLWRQPQPSRCRLVCGAADAIQLLIKVICTAWRHVSLSVCAHMYLHLMKTLMSTKGLPDFNKVDIKPNNSQIILLTYIHVRHSDLPKQETLMYCQCCVSL